MNSVVREIVWQVVEEGQRQKDCAPLLVYPVGSPVICPAGSPFSWRTALFRGGGDSIRRDVETALFLFQATLRCGPVRKYISLGPSRHP